jgi:hypothetical protein
VTAVLFLYLLALGVWTGEIVFFSFVVAPRLFGELGAERAGEVVGVIFPGYYVLGIVASAVAVTCGLVLRRMLGCRWWTGAIAALALGLGATLWAGGVTYPRAQRLRAAMHATGADGDTARAFDRAHRVAVTLNGTALLAGVVGLGLTAAALRR